MEILMIIALAVTCAISGIACEELSADFDVSINVPQIVQLGFESKEEDIGKECKEPLPPAWCPKLALDKKAVTFDELPEDKKSFTFTGAKQFKIAVKKKIPTTSTSKVKFVCEEGHSVNQEVNAGFEILNAGKMCPSNVDPGKVITCKLKEGDAKKMTFGGTCEAKQDFNFTGENDEGKVLEMKLFFSTVRIPTTAAPTVKTTTSTKIATTITTASKDAESITSKETDRRNISGHNADTTTTSGSNTCRFVTRLWQFFFLSNLISKVIFFLQENTQALIIEK